MKTTQVQSDEWPSNPKRKRGRADFRPRLRFGLLLLALLGANRIDGKRIEGFTEPYQTIDVAAAENGIVQDVRVELGQAVKKGDEIGRAHV